MTRECAAKSLRWLSDPGLWTNWPVCPVVRRGGQALDAGIVRAGDPKTVYLINMFMLESGLLDPQLEKVERMTYDGLAAMIADGWEVD